MKSFTRTFSIAVVALIFMAFNLWPQNAYSQKKTRQETLALFPDNIAEIFKQSCVDCHSDPSDSKAKLFMNLSNWDKFKPKKQFKTARSINKQVAKGAMPPESFLKKKPQAAITPAEKITILAWSQAIKKNK